MQQQLQTLRSLNIFDEPYSNTRPPSKLPRTHSQPSFQSSPSVMTLDDDEESLSSSLSISSSSTSSSSSGIILRPTRDILLSPNISRHRRHTQSLIDDDYFEKTNDPFYERKEDIERRIKSLNAELKGFISSIENTEDLVNDVRMDMDDFQNRMKTYMQDIPPSHYSTVSNKRTRNIEY